MKKYLPYVGYFLWSFFFIVVMPEANKGIMSPEQTFLSYWLGVAIPGTLILCKRCGIPNRWRWVFFAFFVPVIGTICFLYKYRKVAFLNREQLAEFKERERIAAENRQMILNREADIRLKAADDLSNGIRPVFDGVPGDFLLSAKDYPLYYLDGVRIKTLKTARRMVGGSQGASVRVAKGLTLHVGGVKAHSENIKVAEDLGMCQLLFSNAYIFVRDQNAQVKRFPRANIVGLKEYSDGCSVDLSTGNPLLIMTSSANVAGIRAAATYEEA